VTNGQTGDIDILDLSDPTSPTWVDSFRPASAELDEPTSVAVFGSVVAATFPGPSTTALGAVVFFDAEGTELASVTVGVSPEMLTFTPDGSRVVVANEAPPQGYLGGQDDPTGSVSIIDVSGDIAALTDDAVTDVGFGALTEADIDETTRVFGPGASVAQDLEPEHIAVSADGNTAWVTLQENNAIATIDLAGGTLLSVTGVGWVDHSVTGLDPSNEDGAVAIATHPVFGMRLPDSVGAFTVGGAPYIVTANEGGSRSYSGFDERERVVDLELDPAVFPNAVMLQALGMLGRLRVTSTLGDIDDDGDYDALYAYGSRSISVFDVTGAPSLVWDSGDAIEQAVAAAFPNDFNSDSDEDASFDSRSDDKGPEPEGLVVGDVFGAPYVFVALERMGGVMIWDLSDPTEPALFEYVNPRDFSGVPSEGTADDLGPEGLVFVAAEDSPTTNPLVVVCNEVSGTVSIYEMTLSVVP
jgi:DNA-binding beta-propeller fold protein YncE